MKSELAAALWGLSDAGHRLCGGTCLGVLQVPLRRLENEEEGMISLGLGRGPGGSYSPLLE